MTKQQARKIFKEKRNAITPYQQQKWDDLILIQFQKLSLPFIETVFSYIAIEKYKETDTSNIIRYLNFSNPQLQVAYPVCDFDKNLMKAIIPGKSGFSENKFGIIEPVGKCELLPEEIDIALIPLLCVDKKGYRVGYGKGFYDKFLGTPAGSIIKIGLSYFEPVEQIADIEPFDIPLDYCITPENIYEF